MVGPRRARHPCLLDSKLWRTSPSASNVTLRTAVPANLGIEVTAPTYLAEPLSFAALARTFQSLTASSRFTSLVGIALTIPGIQRGAFTLTMAKDATPPATTVDASTHTLATAATNTIASLSAALFTLASTFSKSVDVASTASVGLECQDLLLERRDHISQVPA